MVPAMKRQLRFNLLMPLMPVITQTNPIGADSWNAAVVAAQMMQLPPPSAVAIREMSKMTKELQTLNSRTQEEQGKEKEREKEKDGEKTSQNKRSPYEEARDKRLKDVATVSAVISAFETYNDRKQMIQDRNTQFGITKEDESLMKQKGLEDEFELAAGFAAATVGYCTTLVKAVPKGSITLPALIVTGGALLAGYYAEGAALQGLEKAAGKFYSAIAGVGRKEEAKTAEKITEGLTGRSKEVEDELHSIVISGRGVFAGIQNVQTKMMADLREIDLTPNTNRESEKLATLQKYLTTTEKYCKQLEDDVNKIEGLSKEVPNLRDIRASLDESKTTLTEIKALRDKISHDITAISPPPIVPYEKSSPLIRPIKLERMLSSEPELDHEFISYTKTVMRDLVLKNIPEDVLNNIRRTIRSLSNHPASTSAKINLLLNSEHVSAVLSEHPDLHVKWTSHINPPTSQVSTFKHQIQSLRDEELKKKAEKTAVDPTPTISGPKLV